VEPKQRSEVRLRVPGWAPRETLRLEAWGNPLPLRWEGHYLIVSSRDVPAGAALELAYDLPLRETTEVMPVSRREFRLTWRGDEVAACDPEVPIYPVFVKGG